MMKSNSEMTTSDVMTVKINVFLSGANANVALNTERQSQLFATGIE